MATTTASVTFTNTFEDGLTGTITINNVQTSALNSVKAKVKAFNNEIATTDFPQRLVSSTGAHWKKISGCKFTIISRNYFF